ncbi:DciA family protein [Streptomyces sp. ME19-01-6]|uniref:DciA family protein n=1 Tax=Streptomyces sp. ME19-01-6 TaxID=3028686 RepID=UPI0029B9158E|nr:DciA family protein [Streptomyces sp. ME19-01-6]MDX3232536.1 DciA family protein [Streptomyces sp. ME19-01-6]
MSAELSGVDLARQALVAAREAAKKNGGRRQEKPKRSRARVVRRDGREPLGIAAAISLMMTERGMVAPAAGGSVLARWESILTAAAPELGGHVEAVKFDADTGRLDVVPAAPAYGTKLRWSAPKLIAAANEQVKGAGVRTLHVLPPAPGTVGHASEAAAPAGQPAAPAEPVKARETASDGYRRALEAHREAVPARRVDPAIAEALERQTRAMRELSRRAFPEPDAVSDDGSAPIEAVRAQRRRQAAATEAAALRQARAERAQKLGGPDIGTQAPGVIRRTA